MGNCGLAAAGSPSAGPPRDWATAPGQSNGGEFKIVGVRPDPTSSAQKRGLLAALFLRDQVTHYFQTYLRSYSRDPSGTALGLLPCKF